MDLYSLGENSLVHIIHKKPFEYLTGTLKSKSTKQPQISYIPQTTPQPMDIVVNVNGNDVVVPGVKQGMEVVEYRDSFYSATSEGIQQVIANLMQVANNGIAEQPYLRSVLEKGEKYMEQINPQYAEGKKQARTIQELQKRVDKQDVKLDEILTFVRDLTGSPKK